MTQSIIRKICCKAAGWKRSKAGIKRSKEKTKDSNNDDDDDDCDDDDDASWMMMTMIMKKLLVDFCPDSNLSLLACRTNGYVTKLHIRTYLIA